MGPATSTAAEVNWTASPVPAPWCFGILSQGNLRGLHGEGLKNQVFMLP